MEYFYNEQIKKYLIQFMAIFAGFKVKTGKRENGEEEFINVPVQYGDIDRVTAFLKSKSTQNKPIRLPLISCYMTDLDLANEIMAGMNMEDRYTYLPQGKPLSEAKVVHRIRPRPYRALMEVAIYTSNMDQHFQLLEQILPMFAPAIQIQKNDNLHDWTKISIVNLRQITNQSNYPAGTDKRMKITALGCDFNVWLSAPANIRNDFVKEIKYRIGVVDSIDFNNSEELHQVLNSMNINFDTLAASDDVGFE